MTKYYYLRLTSKSSTSIIWILSVCFYESKNEPIAYTPLPELSWNSYFSWFILIIPEIILKKFMQSYIPRKYVYEFCIFYIPLPELSWNSYFSWFLLIMPEIIQKKFMHSYIPKKSVYEFVFSFILNLNLVCSKPSNGLVCLNMNTSTIDLTLYLMN